MDDFVTGRRHLLKASGIGLGLGMVGAAPALAARLPGHAAPASPLFFDVRTFGATGDGKTLDTVAVNAAIAAAAAVGGGTVIFPAGNYLCFSIRLKAWCIWCCPRAPR